MTKHKVAHPTTPTLIEAETISKAWARMVVHIVDHKGKVISPLVLSVANDNADAMLQEDPVLRGTLDTLLKQQDYFGIDVVAFTIFPARYLKIAGGSRAALFELYAEVFPRLQAMNRPLNGRGLYFERLTMAGADVPCNGNQLEWIIQQYAGRGSVRTSMFQASIFDPRKDHTASAQLGFPCLQHVSFIPTEEGLVMNAFYATQKVLSKSYGNYLGLVQLGRFMASEMKLPFVRFNAFVGVAKLDEIAKSDEDLKPVLDAARALIAPDPH